jgi:photosystem II stability/assembly factor-like uncharacterized protein
MKKASLLRAKFVLLIIISFTQYSRSQIITSSFNFGFQTTGIDFIDPNVGYVCGYTGLSGYISKTVNGGTTWTPVFNVPDPSDKDFYFIKSLTANNVVALGEESFLNSSIVYLSTDAGTTWSEVTTFAEGLRDAYFVNSLIGYAVGEKGSIIKTIDGGLTWIDKPFPTLQDLTTTYFINNNIGFVGGADILHKTIDGGNTWVADTIPGLVIKDFVFFSSTSGYLLSGDGNIYYTSDTGDHWTLGINSLFPAMYAMEKNSIGSVISSSNGNLCFKLSGSTHWEKFPGDLTLTPKKFSFLNDTLCFSISDFSGFNKIILKYPDTYVPVVRFESSNSTMCLNISQQFLNNSKPGYTYKWYVNNVFQSSAFNFYYTFLSSGSYNVRLTSINPANPFVKDSITTVINVPATPVIHNINISTAQNPVCEGTLPTIIISPIQFQAWYFITDSLGSIINTINHISGSQFFMTLPAMNNTTTFNIVSRLITTCDTITSSQPFTINVVRLAEINTVISADRPYICDMDSTFISIFNSETGIIYRLMKNNILTSDSLPGNGGTIIFHTHNLYFNDADFKIIARNTLNCKREFPDINIRISKVHADFVPVNQNLFVDDTLLLDNTLLVGDSLKWFFDPNASIYDDTSRNPIVSFYDKGIKTALLTIKTDHGCIDSLRKNIYVYNPAPIGSPTVCGATGLPYSIRVSSTLIYRTVIEMTLDKNKNTILTGFIDNEFIGSLGDYMPVAFIIKCDSNMNVVWEKKLYGPLLGYCQSVLTSCIITDHDGNIFVGGRFHCQSLKIDTIQMTSDKYEEMFVAKFSPDGIMNWIIRGEEKYNQLDNGGPSSFTIDDAGYIYTSFLHNSESILLTFPTGDTLTIGYPNAASILKIDPVTGRLLKINGITSENITGEIQVSRNGWFVWTSLPIGPQIKYAPNGKIYLVGLSTKKQFIGSFQVDTTFGNGYTYFAAVADTALNWENAFQLAGYKNNFLNTNFNRDFAPVFDVDLNGNLYFTFRVEKYNVPRTEPSVKLNGSYYYTSGQFLTKFSSSGSLIWSNLNENPHIATRGLFYNNGQLTITGNFRDFFGYISSSGLAVGQKPIGGEDLFIAQADAGNGDLKWCRKYGSVSGWEYFHNAFKSKLSNDIYVSGGIEGGNFLIENFPIQNTMDNIILAKFNPDTICEQIQITNNIEWNQFDEKKDNLQTLLVSYGVNQINIDFLLNEPSIVNIAMYDVWGRRIESLVSDNRLNGGEHKISYPTALSTGIYLIKLEINNQVSITRKVVVSN